MGNSDQETEVLTEEEQEVLELLGEAWNKFIALDGSSSNSRKEFQSAIHRAQDLVLCRPTMRMSPHFDEE